MRVREGKPLTLPLITSGEADRVAVANEIARQWGQLGVRVEVQTLDADTLRQRLTDHDFTLALYGLQRLGADPDVYEQWHSSQSERGNNYAGLQDEQIDELLFNARRDLDIATRALAFVRSVPAPLGRACSEHHALPAAVCLCRHQRSRRAWL